MNISNVLKDRIFLVASFICSTFLFLFAQILYWGDILKSHHYAALSITSIFAGLICTILLDVFLTKKTAVNFFHWFSLAIIFGFVFALIKWNGFDEKNYIDYKTIFGFWVVVYFFIRFRFYPYTAGLFLPSILNISFLFFILVDHFREFYLQDTSTISIVLEIFLCIIFTFAFSYWALIKTNNHKIKSFFLELLL